MAETNPKRLDWAHEAQAGRTYSQIEYDILCVTGGWKRLPRRSSPAT
jgi:hypothetical protein